MALAVKAERIVGPRAVVGVRRRLIEAAVPRWEKDYQAYFRKIAASVKGAKALDPTAMAAAAGYLRAVGGPESKRLLKSALDLQYAAMTEVVWEEVVGAQVGRALAFDLSARGVERILDKVGTRVTGITESSQRMIAERTAAEIERGSNADVLEKSLQDLLRSWGEDGGRAHIIALTESGNAYNLAATEGYRESGLVERVQVYDGPDCGWEEHDDPDLADGSTRTLDEAEEFPLSHPHCQRAFGPVVLTEEEEPPAPAPEEEPPPMNEPPEAVPEPDAPAPASEPPALPEVEVGPPPGLPDDVVRHLDAMADRVLLDGRDPPTVDSSSFGAYQPYASNVGKAYETLAQAAGSSVDDIVREAEFILQETADDLILSTRRSTDSLVRILNDGRFKSQFETGKSGGTLNPDYRAAAEKYMFGYQKALPVEQRPIYGYLRDPGRPDGASWYGDALMDLRPSVRERTTVVWTDSLGAAAQPSPLNRIRASAFDPRSGTGTPTMPKIGRTGYPYTEAQMHGGVSADDILRVTFEAKPDDAVAVTLENAGFVQTGDPRTTLLWVWERVQP